MQFLMNTIMNLRCKTPQNILFHLFYSIYDIFTRCILQITMKVNLPEDQQLQQVR